MTDAFNPHSVLFVDEFGSRWKAVQDVGWGTAAGFQAIQSSVVFTNQETGKIVRSHVLGVEPAGEDELREVLEQAQKRQRYLKDHGVEE